MARSPIWRRYLRFFGPDIDADVRDELRFHLEAKIAELIDQGRSPEEARREALRQFGDVSEFSSLCRVIGEEQSLKVKRRDRLASWWYDIRHALRSIRREPRFALVAIITLAFGIAGAAGLFSVVDAWIVRAVRFPEPRQLVVVRSLDTRRGREIGVSFADYADLRQRSGQLRSLAAWSATSFTLSVSDGADRVAGATVTPNFFSTLSVEPLLGRAFLEDEGERGRDRVAIVSYGFWKARLNGDPAAVGSKLNLDGEPYTIVGVLPERFHLTLAGRANVWTPLAPAPDYLSRRQRRGFELIGRLKPNVAVEQARQELKGIAGQLAAAYPDTNRDVGASCISLSEEIGRHTGEQIVLIVFGVTLGLLLLACSNVANLLLVRSLGRKRQASIRISLGASRGRLVRQALVETLSLFIIAAVAGAIGGRWFTTLVTHLIPYENRGYLPDYGQASLNGTVLVFVLGVTLVTGLIFGLAPAFEATRANVVAVLKESGSAVSQSRKAKRWRLAFVTAQIVLATILLSATVMLVQSFRATWSTPLGFDSSGVLTFQLALDARQYPDTIRRRAFFDRVLDAMRISERQAKPAIAQFVPFSGQSGTTTFQVRGRQPNDSRRLPSAGFNAVSPEYFGALRTPVLSGRAFETRDIQDERLVAIVNDAFVSQYLRGTNPVGQAIVLGRMNDRSADVVGVVPEIREDNDPQRGYPQIYVPFAQAVPREAYLVMRATGDPMLLLPEIRRRLASIDPGQPAFDAKTLDGRLNEAFTPFHIISGMLVWFGFLALMLAAVGVYGVVAFSVSQQTREIGIRAALGAGRGTLLRIYLRQGISILAAGLLLGLPGGYAAGLALRSMSAQTGSVHLFLPLVFTAAIVGFAGLAATLLPARRAASVDPLAAIRYE